MEEEENKKVKNKETTKSTQSCHFFGIRCYATSTTEVGFSITRVVRLSIFFFFMFLQYNHFSTEVCAFSFFLLL